MKAGLVKKPLFWLYVIILVLSFMDVCVYLSVRSIWSFINKTVGGPIPWAILFFILFCLSFIYALTAFLIYLKKQKDGTRRTRVVNIVIPLVLAVLFCAVDAFLYMMLGSSQDIVPRNLLYGLPYVILFGAIIFFIIFYPNLKALHGKKFRYIAAFIIIAGILLFISNIGGVEITSGPYVQLVDDSNIAVIWTTNCKSTAYVEYGLDENNLKRVYPSNDGIIDANTSIHKVVLPISSSEFIYRVGGQKINNYFQNSVEYGGTAVSGFKKYSDIRSKDNLSFYILSDVHENIDTYKNFLSKDDYDFVVLNGDLVNSVDSDDVIIDEVLKPLSQSTNGTHPIYFVRGNHETRGADSRDLNKFLALPQNNFYYTFKIGPIFGVVLDSGEDKVDSDIEYGGLADFKDYRETETKWLEALSQSSSYKDAKYKLAFVHIPLNSYDDEGDSSYLKSYQQKWRGLLNNMKIDAVFAGHTHVPGVIEVDNINYSFPTFIGGGDYGDEKDYIGIKVEVTKEGMKAFYIRKDGSISNQYEIGK